MFGHIFNGGLLAALLLSSPAMSLLDHPALSSNLDAFGDPLQEALYPHNWEYAKFIEGYIATACKQRAEIDGQDPWKIETFVVTYEDCGVEWLVCRHIDAGFSIEEFIDNFGRVPVRMRQAVKEIMLGPAGGGAYAAGDVIVIRGSADRVGIFLHEVSHAVDWAQHFKYSGGGRMSESSVWADAYNADSAVPDEYARNNQVENMAQFAGLLLFDWYYAGGGLLDDYMPDLWRIGNQLNTMVDQEDNGKYGPILERDNVECSHRTANSGYEFLGSKRRSTGAETRAVGDGPLPDRPDFPNTFEEQKAYIESKGITVHDTRGLARLGPVAKTNCTGYV